MYKLERMNASPGGVVVRRERERIGPNLGLGLAKGNGGMEIYIGAVI